MEEHKTDKQLLVKGIQTMGICLILMFLGPTLLHLAFTNKENETFVVVLIIAIIVCLAAMFFMYRGIRLIVGSIFDRK